MIQIHKVLFYHVNAHFNTFLLFCLSQFTFQIHQKNSMWIFYFSKLIEANMDNEWSPILCIKF